MLELRKQHVSNRFIQAVVWCMFSWIIKQLFVAILFRTLCYNKWFDWRVVILYITFVLQIRCDIFAIWLESGICRCWWSLTMQRCCVIILRFYRAFVLWPEYGAYFNYWYQYLSDERNVRKLLHYFGFIIMRVHLPC